MIKTIINKYKKLLKLNKADIKYLKKKWIINWIWWKWVSLEPIIRKIINLPYFKKEKFNDLYNDIEELSYYHDLDYYIWWWYFKFVRANFLFSYRLYRHLKWTTWTKRIFVFLFIFYILQIYGKQYFNFINK